MKIDQLKPTICHPADKEAPLRFEKASDLMERLMSQLRTRLRGGNTRHAQMRRFFSAHGRDEISIEEDAERKVGWLLKIIFAGTASYVAYQFFPYMGDNLLQQSISLLQVKDPLFKRMGASRLARFAIDDERRMKIIEMGGAQPLLSMLEGAKDDRTRREALRALVALSRSEVAAAALHEAGAGPVIASTPSSPELSEVEGHKSNLLKRFRDLRSEIRSSKESVD
ncbi:unnamed protein product [Spirodela intermedia]|uniref:Uncharacterized protein n=1 Tax=Spirodela intermedia TaxID=51605 RepID=A0A7I8IQN6_SPIIN|nr:unnamed protein product [Spirodela intermedia]CAA6659846.1 unnamed protein product [Spirodela intermedia]